MSKQVEATYSFYISNIQIGSVLDYTLAFMSVALDMVRDKWDPTLKKGFIDITSSRDFYWIYSSLQFVFCGEMIEDLIGNQQRFGDLVAWGGCTIIYLLCQQLHFDLFDFVFTNINVVEVDNVVITYLTSRETSKPTNYG